MRPLILIIAPVLLGFANQAANAQAAPPSSDTSARDLASFVEQERQLLAPFHLIPIIVPRGEQVGDFYDRGTFGFIAGTGDCFPNLKIRKEPGQLPSMHTYSEQGLAAALGASGALDVEGGTSIKRAYVLSFRDVEVRTASVVQLRNAIPRKAAQECEAVRPYLQALSSSKPQSGPSVSGLKIPPRRVATLATETSRPPIPVVIGTVYYARRILWVSMSANLDANAKLSWGQSFLHALGLDASFKLSAGGVEAKSNAVEFVGELVIPVAYAPAFEATMTVAEGGQTAVQIAEINPAEIRVNVAVMEAFLDRNNLVAGASDFANPGAPDNDDHAVAVRNAVGRGFLLGRLPLDVRS